MTGISIEKERIIVSSRLLAPQKCCGKSVDERAVAFKSSVFVSVKSEKLDAGIAAKALSDMFPGIKKKAYEDTDNRKREFSAESRPGVEELIPGHRVEMASKAGPGKRLVLFPSPISQNSISTLPNMGWLDEPPKLSFQEVIEQERRKPSIQLTIYDVDKKTGQVKPESAKKVDQLSPVSGMTFEERQKALSALNLLSPEMQNKKLPGRSLGSMIPGGSLIRRFAGRFGVLMDERNKFRCPPGTPAANQFTDMFGSNCFGFSGSRFSRYASQQAQSLFPDTQQVDNGGFRNTSSSFFRWLYTAQTGPPSAPQRDLSKLPPELQQEIIALEDIDRARLGMTVSYDVITGERIPSVDWSTVDLPENMRLFKHGMANAQRTASARDASVNQLQRNLGIDTSESSRLVNEDLVDTFAALKAKGLWNIDLDMSRMTPLEVRQFTESRLEKIPNWVRLDQKQKEMMIEADVNRYYETERGFLESILDQFIKNPAAARFLRTIKYTPNSTDEASTGFGGGKKGVPIYATINVNMPKILANQELMLPAMRPDQRLGVAAVGAATDAAGQEAVADFLLNANYFNKRMAGLVGGPKTFASFIGTHEFVHIYQGHAFLREAERKLQSPEGLDVPVFDRDGKAIGVRTVSSFEELTGADLFALMDQVNDAIDVKDLDNALSKIENVRMLAGVYPDQYEGSERWGLEASAEIWALRESGLIWGEDVDAALNFIDEAIARPTRVARVDSDVDADAMDLESSVGAPSTQAGGVATPVSKMDATQLEEYLDNLAPDMEATQEIERDQLKEYISTIPDLSENGMIDEAALHSINIDTIEESYLKPLRDEEILDDPNLDPRLIDLRRKHRDMLANAWQKRSDINQKKYDEVKKAWRKKYGVGTRGELERFDENVTAARDKAGLWTPDQARMAAQQLSLNELTDRAENMSEDEILTETVRSIRLLPSIETGSTQALEIATGVEILKNEYVERSVKGGDKRSRARILRDLEEKIEEIISPKPKPSKKFKKAQDVADFAASERAKHRRLINKQQAAAVREIADFNDTPIALMLSPELQVQTGRAINRVTARRIRNNLAVNDRKSGQADLTSQVKNILLPALEAIDQSSASEGFEMEAIMEIAPGKTMGNSIGRVIEQDGFVSGFVSKNNAVLPEISAGDRRNEGTLKTRRRVIVRVREGDRGIFPDQQDATSQNFVMPPGSFTIIGRSDDGTLIVEAARQMNTVEVADRFVQNLTEGYDRGSARIVDDKIWRDGAARKIRPVIDQAILDMRSSGRVVGPTSNDDLAIKETNSRINDDLADMDGYFGEGILADDGRFSSGAVREDSLGSRENRQQRTRRRTKQISSDVNEIREVLAGKGSRKYPELSIDSISPDVREMLLSLSTAEIQTKLDEVGYRFHSGLDRRVRVRMREEDLNELSRSGKFRSIMSTSENKELSGGRRVERLAAMSPSGRAERFSSGAIQDSSSLMARREVEKKVASEALKVFDEIINSGKNVDDMTEGELTTLFQGRVRRTDRAAVSDRVAYVYESDNVQSALALMMAGHHVSVRYEDQTLTKQSQLQFEKLIKEGASARIDAEHPDWLKFKQDFAKANPKLDIGTEADLKEAKRQYVEKWTADLCKLYNPETNLLCSGHIGIEREKMPQLNGRTFGNESLAIRMLVSGQAKGKWAYSGEPLKDLKKILPQKLENENNEQYVSRLRSEGIDQKLIEDYENAVKYDRLSKLHPSKGGEQEPLSEEDKTWFYQNTNWQNVEVDLESEFMEFLEEALGQQDGEKAVRTKEVIPSRYAPSQSQLVASKVDDMNETILSDSLAIVADMENDGFVRRTPEFREEYIKRVFQEDENGGRKNWWTGPILATNDGYILDGHHRWAAYTVANRSLDEDLQIPLRVNEVQTDIIQGLTLGKVFQDSFGIKEARLGVENPWIQGEIDPASAEEVARVKANLEETVGERVDEMYDRGDFIQLGSVGLKNNPNYAEAARNRQRLAAERRPGPAARARMREIEEALEFESRDSSGSFSSGRTTAITSPQRFRRSEASVDAAISRTNASKDTKEAIKFALGLIDAVSEKRSSRASAERIGAEIAKRSGNDIAKLALREMANRGKISKNEISEILNSIDYSADENVLPDKIRSIENAFNSAVEALKQFGDSDTGLVKGEIRTGGSSRLAKIRRQLKRGVASREEESALGKNVGLSIDGITKEYYSRIGLPEDMSDEMLPVPGYIVHKSHIDAKKNKVKKNGIGNSLANAVFEVGDEDEIGDGLTALGDIEVVLKPQISNRTAYSVGDSLTSGARPVRLNSTNREDISDAILGSTNKNSPTSNVETMLHMLAADKSNELSIVNASFDEKSKMLAPNSDTLSASERKPIEAMILGGFDVSEVEQINYPYSRVAVMANNEKIDDVVNPTSIAERLRKAGFSDEEIQYFYSVNKANSLNTDAMRLLKEHRAANKIKKSLAEKGFSKVKIAHPTGINMDDPRSFAKGADSANSIESLLRERVLNEITQQAKMLLKTMRDGKTPSLVSERGGLL